MKKGPTPAMRQFYEMKERYPDAILFFQMGDFYETFGEDAEIVSRELDIVLTSRGKDASGERMPLAGVPIHAGESYIARLVQKGYRVAICEQVEDPKTAKGVVKRDVVRVVTPGTVIDSRMIGSSEPYYLMALAPDKKNERCGIAFLDISTGEFFVMESPEKSGPGDLSSQIARYRPAECLVPRGAAGDYLQLLEHNTIVTPYRYDAFHYETARQILLDHFQVTSLEGYGCGEMELAVSAAGACLAYAMETQKTALAHIQGIAVKFSSDSMILDAITLRNLEILQNIRDRGKGSTLLETLDHTKTAMGSRTIQKMVAAPLVEKTEIDRRLDAVEYFVNFSSIRTEVRSLLHHFADIERIGGRISYGNAMPRDLITLSSSLAKIPYLRDYLLTGEDRVPDKIGEALDGIFDSTDIVELIERAIVDDPPALVKSGGVIREGFDPHLDELREIARSGKTWIADFQKHERERTGIKSLKIGYNKIFGYYIEVTTPNLRLVPPEYQRKQTMANGERFTLPELQEKEVLISNAEERLSAMESEIYAGLIGTLAQNAVHLLKSAKNIGYIDAFAALADVALHLGYVRPVIDTSSRLVIREGRHPVVERHSQMGFVTNDTRIDAEHEQVLIITGANMAGKSTYMRQVALICILAQMGSYVPAAHVTIGVVDRIFTRVGAFDDLASGQSTFMVEMLELANILNNVTPKSLVILDEIGRGTSTLDGFSIAKAVLEFLHGKASSGPRTLFATHFHELVEVEAELRRVRNYHFAVRDTGNEVLFLRKLIPGATDRSYGIHVAALAGTPPRVIKRAEEILKETSEREYHREGKRIPRYTQMLLVDDPGVRAPNPALEELKKLDLDTMTPKEALNMLYELQRAANKEN